MLEKIYNKIQRFTRDELKLIKKHPSQKKRGRKPIIDPIKFPSNYDHLDQVEREM